MCMNYTFYAYSQIKCQDRRSDKQTDKARWRDAPQLKPWDKTNKQKGKYPNKQFGTDIHTEYRTAPQLEVIQNL